MIPASKFEIGQTVFKSGIQSYTEGTICPDCKGSGQWKVMTPAGDEFNTVCQRCSSFSRAELPPLGRTVWVPLVRQLTIGSIKMDTAVQPDWGNRELFSYMCEETGVGSGSIYWESQLHATEEEAQRTSEIEVALKQQEQDAKQDEQIIRNFSHLTIRDATIESAKHAIWDSWYAYHALYEDVEAAAKDDQKLRDVLDARRFRTATLGERLVNAVDAVLRSDSDVQTAAMEELIAARGELAKALERKTNAQ